MNQTNNNGRNIERLVLIGLNLVTFVGRIRHFLNRLSAGIGIHDDDDDDDIFGRRISLIAAISVLVLSVKTVARSISVWQLTSLADASRIASKAGAAYRSFRRSRQSAVMRNQ